MAEPTPMVSMRNISKRFGGVCALEDVNVDAYAGEVLCIVGDNGAGKSTLIKILTGVYQPTNGEILLDGKPFSMSSHSDAIANGIDAVYGLVAWIGLKARSALSRLFNLHVRIVLDRAHSYGSAPLPRRVFQ